jgi:hypothetical protein
MIEIVVGDHLPDLPFVIVVAATAHRGTAPGRHRSPGALTCAKLGRFVQGIVGPVAQSVSMADWPRTSARGFFRADCSLGADESATETNLPARPLFCAGWKRPWNPWPRDSARGLFRRAAHRDTLLRAKPVGPCLAFLLRIGAQRLLPNEARFARMWLIPSLMLLLGVVAAGASHPPASVLVAFAPNENLTAARPAAEKSVARAKKKVALKHKTPVGRPTVSPPTEKPPELRPWPESDPM